MTKALLGAICIAVLCGILVAGLWPFHSPKNQVTWLAEENGLRFADPGTIVSAGEFQPARSTGVVRAVLRSGSSRRSLMTPIRCWRSTLARNPVQLALHQSDTDLLLERDCGSRGGIGLGPPPCTSTMLLALGGRCSSPSVQAHKVRRSISMACWPRRLDDSGSPAAIAPADWSSAHRPCRK